MLWLILFFSVAIAQKVTWVKLNPLGTPPGARIDHKMDSNTQSVFIYGGWSIINGKDNFWGDFWRLNITGQLTLQWERLSAGGLNSARADSGLAILSNIGYMFGGMISDFTLPTNFLSFNPSTKTFSTISPKTVVPAPRYGHSTTSFRSWGGFLIFGGSFADGSTANDLWRYYAVNNTWQELKPVNPPPVRMWHIAAAVDDDTLVIYGGQAWSNAPTFFSDIWAYRISTNSWTKLPGGFPNNLPGTRAGGGGVGCNGKYYIFGGQVNSTTCANHFWMYDTRALKWSAIAYDVETPSQVVGQKVEEPLAMPTYCSTKATLVSSAGKNTYVIFGGCTNLCNTFMAEAWSAEIPC